jgi:hypothetical protein
VIELVSFWTGSLSWIERLCLASMVRQGHRMLLYTYPDEATGRNEIEGLPAHPLIEMRNAAEVLPLDEGLRRMRKKRPAFLADMLRFELLAAQDCAWVDLDMLLLKPFASRDPYFLAYEDKDQSIVNTAALRLPMDSPLLRDIRTFCHTRPVLAPWWTGKRLWKHKIRIALGSPIAPEDSQWGIFGPKLVTYLVKNKHTSVPVSPYSTVYPVPFRRCADLVDPSANVQGFLAADTFGVHLWAHKLRELTAGKSGPPAGSWLDRQMREHGMA